jgi:hypothetical protein
MPLSKLQIEILKLLASHRDPESFVGGSTPLNRNTLRYSGDIDVFHDREEHVAAALDQAEAFVARMPTEKAGLLFLQNGRVVQPDPGHLDRHETHAGQRRDHWPASAEFSSAMLERYNQSSNL